jgi:hypothetical protein
MGKRRSLRARVAKPRYFCEKRYSTAHAKSRRVILVQGEESEAKFRLAKQQLKKVVQGSRP